MSPEDEAILKKFYYDPTTGYSNAKKTLQMLKSKGYKQFNLKDVDEWIKKQSIAQIHKQTSRQPGHVIIAPPLSYQMDLYFYPSSYTKKNKGYSSIFAAIENTTRKGYLVPMLDKSQKSVNKAFDIFLKEINFKIKNLTSDNDSTFQSHSFKEICNKHEIKQYFAEVGDHNKLGLINRFIKTMKDKTEKFFTNTGGVNWVDNIFKLLANYNNTVSESTGKAPNEINQKEANLVRYKEYIKNLPALIKFKKFQIGDKVRTLKRKGIFEKGGKLYSSKTYVIAKIKGYSFKLKNPDTNKLVKRTFKYYELQRVGAIEKDESRDLGQNVVKVKKALKVDRKVAQEQKQLESDVTEEVKRPKRPKREQKPTEKLLRTFA